MNANVTLEDSKRKELIALYLSTFLHRTRFGAAILLFDWLLVWAIEQAYGVEETSNAAALIMISFAAITYYIAEILLTGYYGRRSDTVGAKSVILYATIGSGIILILYAPSSLLFVWFDDLHIGLLFLVLYLAIIHFIHGIFASAKVAPSLGFINQYSVDENRALHMAWYDNAILYGRAAGIFLGGFLWIILEVDETTNRDDQAVQIAKTFPFLSLLLVVAIILIVLGLDDIEPKDTNLEAFSIKEDVKIAARVMLTESRRPMLLPWLSIAALIGSGSLWGPTVLFIVSGDSDTHRGYDALLPLMVILIGLALPAPFWGIYADRKGRKNALLIGLFGMPIAGVLGLAIGFPFYRNDLSVSNPALLLSILPAAFLFSALIPVLMGILGDTAEDEKDGETMSGYHLMIAAGELLGIIIGGLVIGLFSLFQDLSGLFGEGTDGRNYAILIGFVLFEFSLVLGMVIGIYRLPEQPSKLRSHKKRSVSN